METEIVHSELHAAFTLHYIYVKTFAEICFAAHLKRIRRQRLTERAKQDLIIHEVHFNCVACKAAFAFHENISYNKLLIGQDREQFLDIRDKGSLTLNAMNGLLIRAKCCGVFQ